eukprot:scaffold58790_cov65-Phaeocystis_antarctica.AAC.15
MPSAAAKRGCESMFTCLLQGGLRRGARRGTVRDDSVPGTARLDRRQRATIERRGEGGAASVGDLGEAEAEHFEIRQPSSRRRRRTCRRWRRHESSEALVAERVAAETEFLQRRQPPQGRREGHQARVADGGLVQRKPLEPQQGASAQGSGERRGAGVAHMHAETQPAHGRQRARTQPFRQPLCTPSRPAAPRSLRPIPSSAGSTEPSVPSNARSAVVRPGVRLRGGSYRPDLEVGRACSLVAARLAARDPAPRQHLLEELVGEYGHEGALLVVGRAAVAAFDVLVVVGGVLAHVIELAHQLARVARVHAVVARRGGAQEGRVALLGLDVVRRPLGGLIGVAVLLHPRGTRQQRVVAAHVEQRHLADDGAEELGRADQHITGEQPTVGAALAAELGRGRDTARDQVLGDRLEVLEGLVALLLERRLVPARAVLAAAADVGLHVGVALLEPGGAHLGRVSGGERDLEAAVAVEQRRRRAVEAHVLRGDEEVGHLRAVGRGGVQLLRLQPRRVVEGGQRLEWLARVGRGGGGEGEGGRLREAIGGDPDVVRLVRVDARRGHDLEALVLDRALEAPAATPRALAAAPRRVVPPEALLAHDVVERREDQ